MSPETLAYLQQYLEQLTVTQSAAAVHTQLADWLWNNFNRVGAVTADLNVTLRLAGAKQLRNHIPTAAVGNLCGLVLVSANPGFNDTTNATEHHYRMENLLHNQEFGSDFFTIFPNVVGASPWWTKALGFAIKVETGVSPPESERRWAWAQAGGAVANVDLIPFHSTADGFGLLAGAAPAQVALRQIAIATLNMVLNLQPAPRLIFVASSQGSQLLQAHHVEMGLVPVERNDPPPFDTTARVYRHVASGRPVVTFNRQIFAGNFAMNQPPGYDPESLAAILREVAQPRYSAPQR